MTSANDVRCGSCNSCEIERIGCGCDGALDDGCFLCTPKKHARPPCPTDTVPVAAPLFAPFPLDTLAAGTNGQVRTFVDGHWVWVDPQTQQDESHNITVDADGGTVIELYRGPKKLTLYLGKASIDFVRVQPRGEMDDGRIATGLEAVELGKWLAE